MSFTILSRITIDGTTFGLTSSSQLSYFSPGGKARLKMNTTYSVEALGTLNDPRARYHFTSKAEAMKYLKSLESQAVIVETEGVHSLRRLYG